MGARPEACALISSDMGRCSRPPRQALHTPRMVLHVLLVLYEMVKSLSFIKYNRQKMYILR